MSKARNIADIGSNDVLDTDANGVDVTGSITAETAVLSGTAPVLSYTDTDNSITAQIGSGTSDFNIATTTSHNIDIRTNNTRRMIVSANGDITMYKSDGSTAGVTWDASEGTLNLISSSTVDDALKITGSGGNNFIHMVGNQGQTSFKMYENGADDPAYFQMFNAGSIQHKFDSNNGGSIAFNEQGLDIDFRVESNTNSNMLFVDGGNDRVGIGTNTPIEVLNVNFTDTTAHNTSVTKGTNTPGIWVTNTSNTDNTAGIHFSTGGTSHFSSILGARTNNTSHWGTHLAFYTHPNNTSNISTGTEKMRIDGDGRVTMPYQPSWNLRPNTGSDVTHTNDKIGWTTNTSGSSSQLCHIQGVTLTGSSAGVAGATSSGRINVPVAGVYKVWVTLRYENTPGAGNIYLNINGTTRARQHVEVWGRYNYAHGFMSQIVKLSAGDYIEWTFVNGGSGSFSGYNDTVNWCGGYLIG